MQPQFNEEEKPLHMPTVMLAEDGEAFNRVNKELWDKGHYVLPRPDILDLLLAEYFEVWHPWYPVLDKRSFYEALRTNTFSHQLLQAVLMTAATHCDISIITRAGFPTRRAAVDAFYTRTRGLFDGDVEPDKLTNIQTLFLLQFWWRAVTDHKDPLWWLGGAIRQAQAMGLHRSAANSNLSDTDKSTWRRVWWLLYLRDRLASAHYGRPMMIRRSDCDVEPITAADLPALTEVQTDYIIAVVELAHLIAPITHCEFTPGAATHPSRLHRRDTCHTQLRNWQHSLPPSLIYTPHTPHLSAMHLQITFLGALLLLNRPILYTAATPTLPPLLRAQSESIANHAAEAITKTTHDILRLYGPRFLNGHHMSCFFSAMTAQLVDSRSADPARAAEAARKLEHNLEVTRTLEEVLPMANWFRNRLLRTLEGRDGDRAAALSPPAAEDASVDAAGDAGWGEAESAELFDYQWFVDNIGAPGEVQVGGGEQFWWAPEQQHQ